MSRRILACTLALAALAPTAPIGRAEARRLPTPDPTPSGPRFVRDHYRLPNGLEVILAPDPTVTSVLVHVWYHVGSKDEVAGKTGFAHLFEHLMFEGSAHVGEGQFDVLLETAGGWNNGTTDNDRTNYYEQVPSTQLPLALWLEADRMAGLWAAMNQQVLDNQREVVKNERRQSYENRPYGEASLLVQQALWPAGHGNHNLTIGSMADLTAASLADVEAFWRRYYVPSNSTLVLVGGFDVAQAKALVDRYFAWIPTSPRPATVTLSAPVVPLAQPATLETTDDVEVPKVQMAWRTDAPTAASTRDLTVAAQLLGGSRTSRLHRRLVMKDRLATEVAAFVIPQQLGGEFQIHAIARTGVDAAALRTALDEEVARLATTPPSTDEVARAIRSLSAGLLGGLEDLADRADTLATWAAWTGQPDRVPEELDALAKVTPEAVQAAAQAWLAAQSAVTMTILPAPGGAP